MGTALGSLGAAPSECQPLSSGPVVALEPPFSSPESQNKDIKFVFPSPKAGKYSTCENTYIERYSYFNLYTGFRLYGVRVLRSIFPSIFLTFFLPVAIA